MGWDPHISQRGLICKMKIPAPTPEIIHKSGRGAAWEDKGDQEWGIREGKVGLEGWLSS